MRSTTKALLVFGLVAGAATLTLPGTGTGVAKAQGFYIDGPGIHARIGHRHYRRYPYYRDYGYYDYAPRRSICGPYDTLQNGVCKPYRGY